MTTSEREAGLGVLTGATRHGEILFRAIEHQVDEYAGLGSDGADDVVLLAERDENILNVIGEAQALHGPQLRADYLSVASRGQLQIEAAACTTQHHPAVGIHQRGAKRAIKVQQILEGLVYRCHKNVLCFLLLDFEKKSNLQAALQGGAAAA